MDILVRMTVVVAEDVPVAVAVVQRRVVTATVVWQIVAEVVVDVEEAVIVG